MSYFLRVYGGEDKPIGKVLGQVYPELPYALLARLLRQKDVKVDGVRVKESHIVSRGSTLDLFCTPAMVRLVEVYRDDNVLVLYKPKGVESDGEHSFASLAAYVYGDEVRLMHRLDTNTDGLLLFAIGRRAYDLLYAAMREHRIVKYYRARVHGTWGEPTCLAGYLSKDADAGKVRIYDAPKEGAVDVRCWVTPVARGRDSTLVDVRLEGGKTHQLRAQLAHAGHFILGDGKYGVDAINAAMGYKRQQLTAYRLRFDMPGDPLGLNDKDIVLPERWLTTK